jgi:hypothetical protein
MDQMTDDDECPHGLGLKAACTLCNGRAAREARITTEGTTFTARYRSTCFECGNEFDVDERIGRLSNGRYAHEACWLELRLKET